MKIKCKSVRWPVMHPDYLPLGTGEFAMRRMFRGGPRNNRSVISAALRIELSPVLAPAGLTMEFRGGAVVRFVVDSNGEV